MDDTELEAAFRDGLRRRAEEVKVPPVLVGRIRPGRRHRRLGAVAAIAAAAAVVVGVVAADAVRDPRRPEQGVADRVHDDTGGATGWRTESWHGLQVSVPAAWGWGVAGQGCGRVVLDASGGTVDGVFALPYVGRPGPSGRTCAGSPVKPQAPYVWLGADVPAGTIHLGGGYTEQTVAVEGTTLTVATKDDSLRQRIVASAVPETTCPDHVSGAPTVPFTRSGTTEIPLPRPADAIRLADGQVCAYSGGGDRYDLVFATTLTPQQTKAYTAAVYDGGFAKSSAFCDSNATPIVVGVRVQVAENTVVDLACRQVGGATRNVTPLSDRALAVLAGTGVTGVLGLVAPRASTG